MWYAQGGGLTPQGQAARERVCMLAADGFARDEKNAVIAKRGERQGGDVRDAERAAAHRRLPDGRRRRMPAVGLALTTVISADLLRPSVDWLAAGASCRGAGPLHGPHPRPEQGVLAVNI